MSAVGSYPAFSPLPPEGGGRFLLRGYPLTKIFPLGSAALCVARTFLPFRLPKTLERSRDGSSGRASLLCGAKVINPRRKDEFPGTKAPGNFAFRYLID